MTLLAIPTAISSAVSELSHHGHKKGVHGGQNAALDSTSSSDAQSGTTQSLFGSLLDSAEQLVGIQAPASSPSAAANPATASHASQLSPAAMITAARSALR